MISFNRYNMILEKSVLQAMRYATKAHKGQTRSSGEPYIVHPKSVARFLRKYKASKNLDKLIQAALLHDTIEDTDTTHDDLEKMFGGLVAGLVKDLTSDPKEIERLGKKEYMSRKMASMSSYALAIKLADRLDNVQDITTAKTPEWRRRYRDETIGIMNRLETDRKLSPSHKRIIAAIKSKLSEVE